MRRAVRDDRVDEVRELIAVGAVLDVRDAEGMTPLPHAALNGYAECVQALSNAGADPTLADAAGRTALDLAVAGGQVRVAESLWNRAPSD